MPAEDLLVVAGEVSGDRHGARLITELREQLPGTRPFGLGGGELSAAGTDLVGDVSQISVVGLVEALRVLPAARRLFRQVLDEVERRRPAAAVLIDFPGFNLRLARALHDRGIRVVYYISPQVWAWHQSRVRGIARTVDRMLVLFPFEVEFYAQHGVDAVHVGHPLVDQVPQLAHVCDAEGPEEPLRHVSMLPGSRISEARKLLPEMLGAAQRLAAAGPMRFSIIRASSLPERLIADALANARIDVEIVADADRFEVLAASHLALCASGTATLEVGLMTTPMIVAYKLSPWTYQLGRSLVQLPYVSLVNLVLGESAVPELLQREATAERLARRARELLADRGALAAMRRSLGGVRARLGSSGASRRAAEEVATILRQLQARE